MTNDEVVMYIIVNTDLKMGKGKIAAQVGHAVHKVVEGHLDYFYKHTDMRSFETSMYYKWSRGSYTKIVLKGNTNDIKKLCRYDGRLIKDEGRTQIRKGSITAFAMFPIPKSKAPPEIKNLKLL